MTKRVCVFVDGENFRHAIEDLLRGDFNGDEYLPKKALWAEFFDHLVERASTNSGNRFRTYWYVIKHLDFFPYRFPKADEKDSSGNFVLKKLLRKHEIFNIILDGLDEYTLIPKMRHIVDYLRKEQDKMRKRFDGWTVMQNGIAGAHKSVEFRRAGAIRYNLYENTLGNEKAVDVKLATDLILLRDIYDMAVIVSGDQDYVPAVEAVKDFGKEVVNVSFLTRKGDLLPGGAWRLNQVTDWSLQVQHSDLKKYMVP